jgi:hypothetical protein
LTVVDWSVQRYWEDVAEGDAVPELAFPLSVHRLVVEAGANRDFSSIHHNRDYARSIGAPDMFANNVFLQGMWERVVREYIGLAGVINRIGPFRMTTFSTAGEVVTVRGTVQRKWREGSEHRLELAMSSSTSRGQTVSGMVTVTLPTRQEVRP